MARFTKPRQTLKLTSTTIKSMGEHFYREDDGVFLGIVAKDSTSWLAQTIFGYTIARAQTRAEVEAILHERGTTFLKGLWNYFDSDERTWFPCIIKDAHELGVTVIRTNELGFQTPEDYKYVVIEQPTEDVLVKLS